MSGPAADALFKELLSTGDELEVAASGLTPDIAVPRVRALPRERRTRRRVIGVAAALLVATVVLVPLARRGGGPGSMTPYVTGLPYSPAGSHLRSGHWQMVTALAMLRGTWQQNVKGPPGGSLACAPGGTCYVLSGSYRSPAYGAPLLGDTLYATSDQGRTWEVFGLPSGFRATSALSCPHIALCAVGAVYRGRSVLAITADGGHQWALKRLGTLAGELVQLACSSATDCHGVLGNSTGPEALDKLPGHLANETFVTTTDGGSRWERSPLPDADAVESLSCPDAGHCVVVGFVNNGSFWDVPGFSRVTADGGKTWEDGAVPSGFVPQTLSCAGDSQCVALGTIPIAVQNPLQCAATPMQNPEPPSMGIPPEPSSTVPLDPSVAAAAAEEGLLASRANSQLAATGLGFGCAPNGLSESSDFALSTDGGRRWRAVPLPSDVPAPSLDAVTCPSAAVCWAAGEEEVPLTTPTAHNAGSSVLLGSIDGGRHWSKVTFSVPAGSPDAYGQSFLSIGGISCASAGACLAQGATAQGSSTAPVYSLSGSGW